MFPNFATAVAAQDRFNTFLKTESSSSEMQYERKNMISSNFPYGMFANSAGWPSRHAGKVSGGGRDNNPPGGK
ncbi:hypothetical protein [Rhodoferax sediminis]|uniref:Uncharacterized protein n=1 Tax=Rhodoferax sediminis TaxID=2509614 RepID=A0A515D6D1_9BURK|nr:hypothetical protein [Rhodoferax sediminis]QDL35959.1 hypothetical protein EUB48_00615 [Rhodoferax sediminis]